jgi:hypothetical protein
MGLRRFSNYLTGLSDDSAFIKVMRRPYEERKRTIEDLRESVKSQMNVGF